MTNADRKQAIAFQDDIGAVVDARLRDGVSVDLLISVLRDEADHVFQRSQELKINVNHGGCERTVER